MGSKEIRHDLVTVSNKTNLHFLKRYINKDSLNARMMSVAVPSNHLKKNIINMHICFSKQREEEVLLNGCGRHNHEAKKPPLMLLKRKLQIKILT